MADNARFDIGIDVLRLTKALLARLPESIRSLSPERVLDPPT